MTTRREFIATMGALAAAGCASRVAGTTGAPVSSSAAGAGGGSSRLPLAFSTLGAPAWSWARILTAAAGSGYASIELRGLETEMDLTKHAVFSSAALPATRRQLQDLGIRVACVSASAVMHEMDATKRAARLDEGRRFIDLAAALGAPYVRVFGDRFVADVPRETLLDHVAGGLRALGEHARGTGVTVLIESHGDFIQSPVLANLMERTASPQVAILWDAHHTFVMGKEEPEESVRILRPWIRHTHLKDSVPAGDARRYVLTGRGEVPVQRQIAALARTGYTGVYCFEWEKRWHPTIEEPEVAIPDFARVAGAWMREAGIATRS